MYFVASFPGLPLFVLRFVFSIYNTRKRKSGVKIWKDGNTYHVNDVRWTQGGDRGGTVPDYKYVCNKPESEFFTVQAEYSRSCERLGSCLAMEHSKMKSSTLFCI